MFKFNFYQLLYTFNLLLLFISTVIEFYFLNTITSKLHLEILNWNNIASTYIYAIICVIILAMNIIKYKLLLEIIKTFFLSNILFLLLGIMYTPQDENGFFINHPWLKLYYIFSLKEKTEWYESLYVEAALNFDINRQQWAEIMGLIPLKYINNIAELKHITYIEINNLKERNKSIIPVNPDEHWYNNVLKFIENHPFITAVVVTLPIIKIGHIMYNYYFADNDYDGSENSDPRLNPNDYIPNTLDLPKEASDLNWSFTPEIIQMLEEIEILLALEVGSLESYCRIMDITADVIRQSYENKEDLDALYVVFCTLN